MTVTDLVANSESEFFRKDLPCLEVGDKVEITVKNFLQTIEGPKIRVTRFKGTIVSQRNKRRISYSFRVMRDNDKVVAVVGNFSYHSPFILSIKKVDRIKKKIRRAKLYYLERRMAEKRSNE